MGILSPRSFDQRRTTFLPPVSTGQLLVGDANLDRLHAIAIFTQSKTHFHTPGMKSENKSAQLNEFLFIHDVFNSTNYLFEEEIGGGAAILVPSYTLFRLR